MRNEIYNYEMKLLDDVSKERFSFKKIVKLIQLCGMANHIN